MSNNTQLKQAVLDELQWEPSVNAAHFDVVALCRFQFIPSSNKLRADYVHPRPPLFVLRPDQPCLSGLSFGCTDHEAGSSCLSALAAAAVGWILPGAWWAGA